MLLIQIAKAKLYAAKVEVIEMCKRAEATSGKIHCHDDLYSYDEKDWKCESSFSALTGTSNQPRMQKLTSNRRAKLVSKYKTYARHATRYNETYEPTNVIPVPELGIIQGMPISDPFWESAGLSHPDEDWAADPKTREGIEAFRTLRSCQEEMRRIAREIRHLLQWAVEYSSQLDELRRARTEGKILTSD